MVDKSWSDESTLRRLPLPYSLALRLRASGAAPEVVSEYLDLDLDHLDGLYRMAEAKFESVQTATAREGRQPE
ncbi:hypothetical protein [Mycobacterium deserti]|uniref:Uncharacterized protein n=1 Tax=Mycobacterium deserti TaxID=2978347 RepID=A0ABT2MDJ0_9MYCO|nr:hypothetical protein [Mycobacterium deserti]MCT7660329.1 hypothetical protein [Mycobacterium deserti]